MLDVSNARNTDTLRRNVNNTSKSPEDASQSLQTKRRRDVKVGDCELTALVNTGSELALMRTDRSVRIGTAHIVSDTLMLHSLIIGTDFLITVEINIKDGDISIHKIDGKDYNGFPKVSKIEKK